MKSLRRSLNNNSNNHATPQHPTAPLPHLGNNPLARPSEKVAPPQKVIKAIRNQRSTTPQELSYAIGDFLYVTGERDGWYEALNPLAGSRGLVRKSDFEEFAKGGKNIPVIGGSRPGSTEPSSRNASLSRDSRPIQKPPPQEPNKKKAQPVYAIVQYDFQAERPDELDAKKGEPIVIIAQSNHEWFVAKPIGRLGGPGLIPVAFVDLRDPTTNLPIDRLPDSIPMVEEWKKAAADYKAAAIPLGRFDLGDSDSGPRPPSNHPFASTQLSSQTSLPRSPSNQSVARPLYRPEHDPMLPPGDLVALSVPSFHNESGNYWFRLQVTYVPDELSAPAYSLSLYRTYEDFYDFQISLLDSFPVEAGRPQQPGEENQEPPERILPYMPGPVDEDVDDELTEFRREELDAYVNALINLRTRRAGYILRHELVRTFFAAKYGDYCEDAPRAEAVEELEERLAEIRMEDENAARSATQRSISSGSHQSHPSLQYSQGGHTRNASSSRASPHPPVDPASRPSSGANPGAHYTSGGPSTGNTTTSSFTAPQLSANASAIAGAGAGGGQPPFVKIKIYDRSTDDLIAIRVHPNVSHSELFDKVRARLGSEVNVLRFRTSMTGPGGGGYREIRDDSELRDWMRTEDQKLVLYAEQE